ncbi:5'-3' exoribonuclease 3-like isoform X1 [Ipomoea triloba]|uniref:5'-3' exoribonuclease 3-like isoform X1 n=2 Tax=Ipomoea triloba TaxID=35885 RepID=UPI00125D27A5|nr:5'-3' exoribonuclease 3-like isoform X1 [Ipomoea triloba]XP_031123488.1 5'-3' exoribonuclease 3-like isoform X1 [Ipomoea triloba]
MGVPSFYRWLVNKYPKIVENAVEDDESSVDFDNFYVDMNGIIHACFHPEDDLFPPTTYEEVFQKIYDYIDRLFNIVRPRKLLYLAIDGVAPRAKMNQQRARRFRTAKDKEIIEEEEMKLREKYKREGKIVLEKEESEVEDSNVITPGTLFMYILSEKLQIYIQERIRENPGWKNIKVILSDSNVPGEGEHKINSFIHAQRMFPGYNPNTRHCLYGLDADLIMLALASHELHFSVLRENVLTVNDQSNHLSSLELSMRKAEDPMTNSRGWFKQCDSLANKSDKGKQIHATKKDFQFLKVWVLREYLDLDIRAKLPEDCKADLERVVDDFVFICFFAGNDFLPHMPTLEIHEGALDLLLYVYKKEFKNPGDYLVDMERVGNVRGYIKLSRVERFILSVGQFEEKIFKKRMEIREKRVRRVLLESRDDQDAEEVNMDNVVNQFDVAVSLGSDNQETSDISLALSNTKDLKQELKDIIRSNADTFKYGGAVDKVKFGEAGWRERYYTEKFKVESGGDIESTRKAVVAKYTEGLHWVLLYYYKGVPSWNWFYPYHYGPSASDLKGMSQTKVKFQNGQPFKPFDQLMSVLPPRSAHALPEAYGFLMQDENSNIVEFYPTVFDTDLDGKRFAWQGISKLPFIDEERLLVETRKLDKDLTDLDRKRNMEAAELLYMEGSCKLALHIMSSFKNCKGLQENDAIQIGLALSDGVSGLVWSKDYCTNDLPMDTLCVFYRTLPCSSSLPRVLEGTDFPEQTVFEADIGETVLWHELNGRPGCSSSHRYHNHGSSVGRASNSPRNHRNSVPDEFVKGSGCGWAGRGGRHFSEPELQNPNNFPRYSPSRPVVNSRIHPSSSPRERPSSMTAYSRQPIGTPSNQVYRPRSPVVVPLQSFCAPSVSPWGRGNAGPRNSGLESQWRVPAPVAAVAPADYPWRNAGPRNSGLENQWRMAAPPAAPTDSPWIRVNAGSRNSGVENQWRATAPAAVSRGGQPVWNNQNNRR